MAGYKAFILLTKLLPTFLNTLPPNVWEKWASIIIAYPESSGIAGQVNAFVVVQNLIAIGEMEKVTRHDRSCVLAVF